MAENKTKPTEVDVEAYVDAVPDAGRRQDALTLVAIMQRLSGEPPKMWGPSIIGFGSCHYRYESGREGDMPLTAFSPRARELVLYVLGFPGQEALLARLGRHKTGKACLYIKSLADVDGELLEEIIAASIHHSRTKDESVGC